MNIIKHKAKIITELKNKEYRDAFVSEHIDTGIPFQIRAIREQRGWTQKELAKRAGVTQVWISRIENPNYSGFSIKTLLKLAAAFDIGLIVRFVPISNLVKWELELSPESLQAISFDEDPYFQEAPQPPIYTYIARGGFSVGGGGIANFINPLQPSQAKAANFVKYREAKQKELKSQLPKFLGMEECNEIRKFNNLKDRARIAIMEGEMMEREAEMRGAFPFDEEMNKLHNELTALKSLIREMGEIILHNHGIIPEQTWQRFMLRPEVKKIMEGETSEVGMKIYYEIKPKHYVGGVSITIRFPEGTLSYSDRSILEEAISKAEREIAKTKV